MSIRRAICLGVVSYLALSIDFATDVQAQSALPPVTVDAPSAQPKPRTSVRPRSTAPRSGARTARRSVEPVQPVAVAPVNRNSTIQVLPTYAGGQVATGGQVGFLGNRNLMDTPFNQTSYTSKTVQDQQARSVNEILNNDPSVNPMATRYSSLNTAFFRGFVSPQTYNADMQLNGLSGLVPYYSPSTIGIERAEVLKGPSALLNGMPPNGAVGGTVNLVTKKAGEEPLAQLTTSYVSRSILGAHVDVGQRYGENKEFGIRFNGAYANGETAITPQSYEQGVGTLNVDYRSERFRVSGDIGYQVDHIDATMRFISVASLARVPAAPDASRSLAPNYAFENSKSFYGVVRGEADLTDNTTVYAAVGTQQFENYRFLANSSITNLNGSYAFDPFRQRTFVNPLSSVVGVRTTLVTGPIEHELNTNWSHLMYPGGDKFVESGAIQTSNIYNPVFGPAPFVRDPGHPIPKTYETNLSSVGFADTMSILNKRVQLTVGVRRQNVEQEQYNPTTGAVIFGYGAAAWSPAYAIVVKPLENVSLYANYIQGLQQGTVVGAQYANEGQVLPPYQTEQYEAGVKVDWGRITTTLSAFQIAQPSTITVPPGAARPTLAVDGEQVNKGLEFLVFGEVVQGVRLLGGATYIDGRLAKTQNGTFDGKQAQGAPYLRVVLGSELDMPFIPGFTLTGRLTYTDDQPVSNVSRTLFIPEWTRIDLGARYTFASPWNNKPITVRFNVENVFDKNYWVAGYNGFVMPSQPRTYMASSTFNF